jgi:ABC-2 type transport system permease protein
MVLVASREKNYDKWWMNTVIRRSIKDRVIKNVYIYFRIFVQNLRAILEYQTDFIITMIVAIITQLLGFFFLHLVFQKVPDINGWTLWEVLFMYAMLYISGGVSSLFFGGLWSIGSLVRRGGLDLYLIRPVSPLVQVLASNVGMNGLGNLVTGGIILTHSLMNMNIAWSVQKGIFFVIFLISAVIIRTSIIMAANSSAFWIRSARNTVPFLINTISDFVQFPITIYPLGIRTLVTMIFPYAFIGFFPANYLFKDTEFAVWGLLTPLVAIYCMMMAVLLFKRGLKSYESVGN